LDEIGEVALQSREVIENKSDIMAVRVGFESKGPIEDTQVLDSKISQNAQTARNAHLITIRLRSDTREVREANRDRNAGLMRVRSVADGGSGVARPKHSFEVDSFGVNRAGTGLLLPKDPIQSVCELFRRGASRLRCVH
jgi:hypothetical protein